VTPLPAPGGVDEAISKRRWPVDKLHRVAFCRLLRSSRLLPWRSEKALKAAMCLHALGNAAAPMTCENRPGSWPMRAALPAWARPICACARLMPWRIAATTKRLNC
jgi:hypothetical protein